jgi:uncharacterized protein
MNPLKLTEFLIKSIIVDSDSVSLKEYEDEEYITIEILVSEEEMGRIIGKGGNMIKSIRTIVQAAAFADGLKKVRINVEAF